jgi:hypothetical protein
MENYGELLKEENVWMFKTAMFTGDAVQFVVGDSEQSYLAMLNRMRKEKWKLHTVVEDEKKYILSKKTG